MEIINNNKKENEQEPSKDGKLKDYQPKKVPDEEVPSLLGDEPDLLKTEPETEEDKSFLHIHNHEELVEEPKKADDGLL